MAEQKKVRPPPMLSPKGVAHFPWLNKADYTQWKNGQKDGEDPNKGKYKTGLILDRNDPVHAKFLANLKTWFEEAVSGEKAKIEAAAAEEGKSPQKFAPAFYDKKGDFKEASYPWKDHPDDDSKVIVQFSMNAQYQKKDKSIVKIRPNLWTSKLKEWPLSSVIGGGSEIIVSFNANPFAMAAVGAGLSLQMQAVQVVTLKTFGAKSAQESGFSAVDGDEPDAGDSTGGFSAQDGGDEPPPPGDADAPPPTGARREF